MGLLVEVFLSSRFIGVGFFSRACNERLGALKADIIALERE